MTIVGKRKVSLSRGGYYEPPKCIVIGASDQETLLQTGSVTFSSSSGTDDTWSPDEKGDTTTYFGLGSDPSDNY